MNLTQAIESETFNQVVHMRQVLDSDDTPVHSKLCTLMFMTVEAIDAGHVKFETDEAKGSVISLLAQNLSQLHRIARTLGVEDSGEVMH